MAACVFHTLQIHKENILSIQSQDKYANVCVRLIMMDKHWHNAIAKCALMQQQWHLIGDTRNWHINSKTKPVTRDAWLLTI